MTKKIAASFWIPLLLSSCISIVRSPAIAAPQQDFVTATVPPTLVLSLPTPSPISSETSTPSLSVPGSDKCIKAAILLRDVTIPDGMQVQAGETFIKTWEFQNTGSCHWNRYTLKLLSGDPMGAPLSFAMPAAAPNEKVQVSMELTAPTADGTYSGTFALYDPEGDVVSIGGEQTFWVKFRVGTYVAGTAIPGSAPIQWGNCSQGHNADYVSQILSLINTERANAGLAVLLVDAEIATFAQSHSDDMAFNNFLSHDGSDGSFGERMMHYNIEHPGSRVFGEILAIGTPQDAMDQWRRDEHWDYVLGSGYTRMGAGYAYSSCSDYGGYFTVDFG
jgi:uncharacterized protein YkwD